MRVLQQRDGALPQEQQIHAISELMCFARGHNETTDEVLARWDVIMFRAIEHGGAAPFNVTVRAWIVLTHLRIPKQAWPTLLAPFVGMLPTTEDEYILLIGYIRRNSHLHESKGDRMKSLQQPFFSSEISEPSQTYATWSEHPQDWSGSNSGFYPSFDQSEESDAFSWQSFSTANSEVADDLTWSDIEQIPPAELNDHLYNTYVFHKRRFRAVGFKRHRFVGRPKGQGKGKGKGGHSKQSVGSSG